jgi:hypothetical protein
MTKRMIFVTLAIAAIMLFLVIPELITGMSIFDAFLSSMGFNVSITIDITPPYVEIIIPEPITYPTETVTLEYNITDVLSPISTIWYNLDNGTNVTITHFVTITIPSGEHVLYLYANDTAGNINFSYVNFNTTATTVVPGEKKGAPTGEPSGIFEEPKKNVTELPAEFPATPPEEGEVPTGLPAEIKVALSKEYKFWYSMLIIVAVVIYLALYMKKQKEKYTTLKGVVKRRGRTE